MIQRRLNTDISIEYYQAKILIGSHSRTIEEHDIYLDDIR